MNAQLAKGALNGDWGGSTNIHAAEVLRYDVLAGLYEGLQGWEILNRQHICVRKRLLFRIYTRE